MVVARHFRGLIFRKAAAVIINLFATEVVFAVIDKKTLVQVME